jgi:pimeloyl-ACP methyl ester carboxylesterase
MTQAVTVRHGKSELALHCVRDGEGAPALVLHGLAENGRDCVLTHLVARDWPGGAVWALDFLGHGDSTRPPGGGYTAETLMADADAALRHIGAATVFGRGLGAYIAVLIAGARPDLVRGAVLCDGPGLNGGGSQPASPVVVQPRLDDVPKGAPDPFALAELARDVRPPDYVANFLRQVLSLSPLDVPITVCAIARPEWLDEIVDEPGVQEATLADAISLYGMVKE